MSKTVSKLYLVPSLLDEEAVKTLPFYITDAIRDCQVFFVENERTARRFLKKLWKFHLPGQDIVIDSFEWFTIGQAEGNIISKFRERIGQGKNIGIISEAGCPGIADPGQELVAIAHEIGIELKPLVGPNSILLALMASGLNGQQFQFLGYLPIQEFERVKAIREIESESAKKNCTQIFIETPYRNNQLVESILKTCKPSTKFCVAVELTGNNEWISTRTIDQWRKEKHDFHKRPAIFLLKG